MVQPRPGSGRRFDLDVLASRPFYAKSRLFGAKSRLFGPKRLARVAFSSPKVCGQGPLTNRLVDCGQAAVRRAGSRRSVTGPCQTVTGPRQTDGDRDRAPSNRDRARACPCPWDRLLAQRPFCESPFGAFLRVAYWRLFESLFFAPFRESPAGARAQPSIPAHTPNDETLSWSSSRPSFAVAQTLPTHSSSL